MYNVQIELNKEENPSTVDAGYKNISRYKNTFAANKIQVFTQVH